MSVLRTWTMPATCTTAKLSASRRAAIMVNSAVADPRSPPSLPPFTG